MSLITLSPCFFSLYSSKNLRFLLEMEKRLTTTSNAAICNTYVNHKQQRRMQIRQGGPSAGTCRWKIEGTEPQGRLSFTVCLLKLGNSLPQGNFYRTFKIFGQISRKKVNWALLPPLSLGSGNPGQQMTESWYSIPVLNAFHVLIL